METIFAQVILRDIGARYRIKPFPEHKQDVKREMYSEEKAMYVVLQSQGNIVDGALSIKLIAFI